MKEPDSVEIPLEKKLEGLARFLQMLEDQGSTFGHFEDFQPELKEDGVLVLPLFIESAESSEFTQAMYDQGWVRRDFDWPEWMQTEEAIRLRDDPDALAAATPDQLSRLLTVVIRQERFCDGAIAAAFDSGLLAAIARRARDLLAE